MVGRGCEREGGREKEIMRGSESRLRHVLSELGQWVSPPPRIVHLLRRTHREALALSGSANGVTVDPATACMWPVRAFPVPAYRDSVFGSPVLFESKSCSPALPVRPFDLRHASPRIKKKEEAIKPAGAFPKSIMPHDFLAYPRTALAIRGKPVPQSPSDLVIDRATKGPSAACIRSPVASARRYLGILGNSSFRRPVARKFGKSGAGGIDSDIGSRCVLRVYTCVEVFAGSPPTTNTVDKTAADRRGSRARTILLRPT